jgi:hypothetical protein
MRFPVPNTESGLKGAAVMMTDSKLLLSVSAAILVVTFASPAGLFAREWDVEPDSIEITSEDIDRPYEIQEIVSFKVEGKVPEDAMQEAEDRLRKTASRAQCDAVIFVDMFTERIPTEVFVNAILVQSLDSTEAAERRNNYDPVEDVREKVEKKEIILSEKDINYPYKIRQLVDILAEEESAKSMTNIDGQLADLARKKRGHAVIFIRYDRSEGTTQVNGAKGILVRFDRGWLKTGKLD